MVREIMLLGTEYALVVSTRVAEEQSKEMGTFHTLTGVLQGATVEQCIGKYIRKLHIVYALGSLSRSDSGATHGKGHHKVRHCICFGRAEEQPI